MDINNEKITVQEIGKLGGANGVQEYVNSSKKEKYLKTNKCVTKLSHSIA
jgi:hypothetical protein